MVWLKPSYMKKVFLNLFLFSAVSGSLIAQNKPDSAKVEKQFAKPLYHPLA